MKTWMIVYLSVLTFLDKLGNRSQVGYLLTGLVVGGSAVAILT